MMSDLKYVTEYRDMVMADIASRPEWSEEVGRGKMFGVLVYRDEDGAEQCLKAYSGQILGRSDWEGYVPAIFDYLQEDGYFKEHERIISGINRRISEMETSREKTEVESEVQLLRRSAEGEIAAYRQMMQESKARRHATAAENVAEQKERERESQYQKAELRRLKARWTERIAEREGVLGGITREVTVLKRERRERSDALQRWLFTQFRLCNAQQERRPLLEVFSDYAREHHLRQVIPPSGTGECCAPKLLHYANEHHITPIALAEFWYGDSPKGEVRHHGQFYEPCQAKCMPILPFLLPHQDRAAEVPKPAALDVIYEDDYLLAINKPPHLLSVPGKNGQENAEDMLKVLRPDASFLKMVHRLDMDTSGILLCAKDPAVHAAMQKQFAEHRTVKKEYIAVIHGTWTVERPTEGTISLPLSPDYLNRPRQRVDYDNGKEAVTEYETLSSSNGNTSMKLRPLTGRTHQLRMHCAHRDGLAMPIVGDPLYGDVAAERMFLHASRLEFQHPVTHEKIAINCAAEFF